MGALEWGIVIAAVLLLGGIVAMFVYTFPISKRVYEEQLVRTSPDKWGRVCSAPDNAEQAQMWEDGITWSRQHTNRVQEVSIQSDGFTLYGEYFDFGKKRCVIILPGRCESLVYSYYFAPPYEKAGCNILVIDTRCHGKSDGTYNSIGVNEKHDVQAWARYVSTTFGNEEVYIHGICIGTAAGLFAMADADCPECIKGLITEGCFVTFRETFKRHMMAEKRPLFPVLDTVMLLLNHYTKTNVYRDTPLSTIKHIPSHQRMLFLYGKHDIFSIPSKSQKLFNACSVADKKLVWFPKGGHSHLRINNTEAYDDAIVSFFEDTLV